MARTAVLIHGCHLQAIGWKDIVWGNVHGLVGRVPKGVLEAAIKNAQLIFWGTGASEKDGKKESQYAFDYAIEHADDLKVMINIADTKAYQWSTDDVVKYLRGVSFIDTKTQNTTEEIRVAIDVCVERGITELCLVSSPTHIARCLQEAVKVLAERGNKHDIRIYATASDTCFANSTPESVVIVEPPHRGDMPLWQTYRYAKAMFGIMRKGDEVFADFLRQFAILLRSFGVEVTWDPLRK